jgi:uncharacterized protein DUF4304
VLPSQAFNHLLKVAYASMKPRGFSRKGQSFYLYRHANWGIVNFQKSTGSTREKILFTINLGVASTRLLEFFESGRFSDRRPNIWDCHWHERIGSLLPGRQDTWWSIDATTPLEELTQTLCGHLQDVGIPEIEKHISDVALRDLWLTEFVSGVGGPQNLEPLSVLLKILGPQHMLDAVLERLRNTRGVPRGVVEGHIKRLSAIEAV